MSIAGYWIIYVSINTNIMTINGGLMQNLKLNDNIYARMIKRDIERYVKMRDDQVRTWRAQKAASA